MELEKEDILKAMKECGGQDASVESTDPAECMAGLLLDTLEF